MKFAIYENGKKINTIEAKSDFVEQYCKSMGYTYFAEPVAPAPVPEPEPTETEQLRADVDFLAAMAGVTL